VVEVGELLLTSRPPNPTRLVARLILIPAWLDDQALGLVLLASDYWPPLPALPLHRRGVLGIFLVLLRRPGRVGKNPLATAPLD